jgi:pimeloyl-ACP methyl ester carboxylesterase
LPAPPPAWYRSRSASHVGWRCRFRRPTGGAITAAPIRGAITPAPIRGAITPAPIRGAITPAPIRGAITAAPIRGAITRRPSAAPPPRHAPAGAKEHVMREHESARDIWFEHERTRLYAVETGEGRPIILLHGGLATHAAARLYADGVPGRVITPDLRGSGASHFAGELTWDLLADDVAALARHLGITRAIVGGASFGAGVAVRVALRHPTLVAGLAVLQPAYGGAELGLTAAQRAAMDAMDAAGRRAPAEGIDVLFPLLAALPPEMQERARRVFATYDPASVAASTRFMASGAQPFARGEDLAAIACPALLVPGADPTHQREVADVFARHLPRCTVAETTGALRRWLEAEREAE